MTNQQQRLDNNTVNSITFFNPPYNIQHTTYQQPNDGVDGDMITSHNIQHAMQELSSSSSSSTIYYQQQSSSQFRHPYPTTSLRNSQFTTITYTIPSITPTSTNLKYNKPQTCATSSNITPIKINDEKRAQRKERNRIAAKECRERRKAYILNLENKASSLEDENLKCRQRILESKTKLEWIESKSHENIQLKNLVISPSIMILNDKCIKGDQEGLLISKIEVLEGVKVKLDQLGEFGKSVCFTAVPIT
ncbi:10306_t:CDS:2 [Funneliformis mosseae]|uniref:10306_t:CDS:1 n=1 Tax=Funneliformis mosseae TaxID=27381 RepID=A0A9N9E2K5_FUNMO|nr:10306_t:CDS:2 [Funneliformis mosseae]